MDWRERLHSVVLSTIVRDFPEGFWADIRTGARQAYLDVFHQVDADPNLVSEQRIDTLFQVRHFRMEHLLTKISLEHGIRSEEHTSELKSLMRKSYAVFCLKKKKN